MSDPDKIPDDIAQAAWQASGMAPRLLRHFQLRWRNWLEWCDANSIDASGTCQADSLDKTPNE